MNMKKELRKLIDCLSMLYDLLVGEGPWEQSVLVLKNIGGNIDPSCFTTTFLSSVDSICLDQKSKCATFFTSVRMVSEGSYYDAVQTATLYRSICCNKLKHKNNKEICTYLLELLRTRIYRALITWGKVACKCDRSSKDKLLNFIDEYVCHAPSLHELSNKIGKNETWKTKVLHILWPDIYSAADENLKKILNEIISEKGPQLKKFHVMALLPQIAKELYGDINNSDKEKRICSGNYVLCPSTGKTLIKKVEQALWLASTKNNIKEKLKIANINIMINFILNNCGECTKTRLSNYLSCGSSCNLADIIAETLHNCLVETLREFINSNKKIKDYLDYLSKV